MAPKKKKKLSKQVMVDLREAFELFDQDKNGYIDAHELYKVFKCLAFSDITEEDCKQIIKNVDMNVDEMVDFDGFVNIFEVRQEAITEADMARVHKDLADPISGNITPESLKASMQKLGFSDVTEKLVNDMIQEISVGGMSTDGDDGSVCFAEFHNLMKHKGEDLSEIELAQE